MSSFTKEKVTSHSFPSISNKGCFTFSPGLESLSSLNNSTFMESLTSLYLVEKKSRKAAKMRLPKMTMTRLKLRTKVAKPEKPEKRRARRVTFRYMSETLSEDKSLNPAIDFLAIRVDKKPELTECISEAVERTQFVAE